MKMTLKLFETALARSTGHDVKTIYLGLTPTIRAVHRFYEKHGFCEVAKKDVPSCCQLMDCDEKFYPLGL